MRGTYFGVLTFEQNDRCRYVKVASLLVPLEVDNTYSATSQEVTIINGTLTLGCWILGSYCLDMVG